MMSKLWLTYAWKDNEAEDVDFVVGRLSNEGLEVRLDRNQLLAGRRLWEGISAGIADPAVSGWAIYATENSLRSEPCQEELAYALDRALRTRGVAFPLIGIFPTPMDHSVIPSALATRLYVTLKDTDWASKIAHSLSGNSSTTKKDVKPYDFTVHRVDLNWVYEMRPREGVWHPASVAVLETAHPHCVLPFVTARGRPDYSPPMYNFADVPLTTIPDGSKWKGWRVEEQVDNTKSLYLRSSKRLHRIAFGSGRLVVLDLT